LGTLSLIVKSEVVTQLTTQACNNVMLFYTIYTGSLPMSLMRNSAYNIASTTIVKLNYILCVSD